MRGANDMQERTTTDAQVEDEASSEMPMKAFQRHTQDDYEQQVNANMRRALVSKLVSQDSPKFVPIVLAIVVN